MKQVVISLGFLAFVILILSKGTLSFFSNTETLDDNFGIAGQINLLIGNTAYKNNQLIPDLTWDLKDQISGSILAFENLLPGDSGSNIVSFQITDNPSWLCSEIISNITSESDKDLDLYLWADDGDGVLESDESEISQSNLDHLTQNPVTLATKNLNFFEANLSSPLNPAKLYFLGLAWCAGDINMTPINQDFANDQINPIITPFFECITSPTSIDSLNTNLSLGFHAVQARNNNDFSCNHF